jgi:hypothetical protein
MERAVIARDARQHQLGELDRGNATVLQIAGKRGEIRVPQIHQSGSYRSGPEYTRNAILDTRP